MAYLPHGLTVGLIAGSKAIWRWQYQLIQSLIDQDGLDVRVIILLGTADYRLEKSVALLHKLDGMIFKAPVDAFDLIDVSRVSTNCVSSDEAIKNQDSAINVLINFSEAAIPDELIQKASFGVLTPIFSEDGELKSQALGIKQYLNNQKQVYLSVLNQSRDGQMQLLATAQPSFDQGSVNRNLNQYWIWLIQLWRISLGRLSSGQKIKIDSSVQRQLEQSDVPVDALTLGQSVASLLCLSNHVQQKLKQKYLYREQWVLLFKHLKANAPDEDSLLDFFAYHELSPPEDCFWADPFVFSKDGRDYVFFEELPFATERGHLCCMEVFADGTHSEPIIIIQEGHHLSYPNVFEYESECYLIPESGDNGNVDIYRCSEFPYQWELHKTLIKEIHAYDSTLIEYQGVWWLFATVVPELGLSGCEALHIFYSDSPLSTNWQSHANNPVISDASRARPAGNFYIKNNQLYRVSQDCAGQYGAGLNINEVTKLTTDEYDEKVVSCHRPDWDNNLIALHTFNSNNNIAVADALRVKKKVLFND